LPAVAAGGQPAARPGRLGAACSSGRHRRQAGHPWPPCWARWLPWIIRSPTWRPRWLRCWPAPRAPSSPRSAGWPPSPRLAWSRSWATPGAGRSGPRCGEQPGWLPPAAIRRHRRERWHQPGGLGLGARGDPGPGSQRLASTGTLARRLPSPHPRRAQAPQARPGRRRQPGRTDLVCRDGQRRRLRPRPPDQTRPAPHRQTTQGRWSSSLEPGTLAASGGAIRRRFGYEARPRG
jgi:hypothetical protein